MKSKKVKKVKMEKEKFFICVAEKKYTEEASKWYHLMNTKNKIIFIYENSSSYLFEYEKYKKDQKNIFSEKNEIIKMNFFEYIQNETIYDDDEFEPFLIDFDLFYKYINDLLEEKKYGKIISEIEKNIYIFQNNHFQQSLFYNILAKSYQHSGYDEYEVIEMYEKSYQLNKEYLVPFYELLVKYRLAGLFEKGVNMMTSFFNTFGGIPTLFNDSPSYDQFIDHIVKNNSYYTKSLYTYLYFTEFEAIICYIHYAEELIKNEDQENKKLAFSYFEIAYQLCNRIMLRKMVIADESIKQINHFKSRCIEYIKDKYIFYNREKVEELTEKSLLPEELKDKNGIIFTVTTCKRFDLFEKTMNALINCTKDIDMIQEWLCVDDNSSEEDRILMKEKYPFFTYIWKSPQEKGHSKSMNIIRDYVINSGYKYTLHMEDDWVAVCEMDYMKPSIRIIEENSDGIRQVVQNRQYVQLIRPRDIDLKGGFQKYLKDGYRYILHEFYPRGSPEEAEFWKRINGGFSASYWPHYSLNPAVMSSEIYKCLGRYREDVKHFEMDYASRFTNAGFKTAFLDGIFRLHIGKLIGEEGKKNAYELNDLVQFSEKS